LVIVSDRGTAFTSKDFEEFLKTHNIKHIKVATGSPQANGQVERINRCLGPMLAKLTSAGTEKTLNNVLPEIEFALNNTSHKSTGTTASELLFGVSQRGVVIDFLKEELDEWNQERNLIEIRNNASNKIINSQKYNEQIKNKGRIIKKFKKGDYVVLKNFVSVPGACKKVIPKYKGPYKVDEALENDRYAVSDVEGFQLSQIPYKGIWEAANMKLWIESETKDLEEESETTDLDDEIEKQDLDDEIEKQDLDYEIEKQDLDYEIEKQDLDDEIEKQDLDDDIEKKGKEVEMQNQIKEKRYNETRSEVENNNKYCRNVENNRTQKNYPRYNLRKRKI